MKKSMVAFVLALAFVTLFAAAQPQKKASKPRMSQQTFGKTADGQEATLYTLENKQGMEVAISNFGGTIVSIKVSDHAGNLTDVVLGYDQVADYAAGKSYFGGTIGRYGNRIARGEFPLDGAKYKLAKNDGENHLHGGIRGSIKFSGKPWTNLPQAPLHSH